MAFRQSLSIFLFSLLFCCTGEGNKKLASADKDESEIILPDTSKDEIPVNFDKYKGVKSLTIRKTEQEWAIFPPLSAWNKQIDQAEHKILPEGICNLSELETLRLPGLKLTALPDCLGDLQNLDSLDLEMNYLTVKNEIDKLKALPKLKYLNIFGNRIDTAAVKEWQNERSDLNIVYK